MDEVKQFHLREGTLVEGKSLGCLNVYLASDYDKLRARVAELAAAITASLPCSYYMDLPDGGSPSLEEQLKRMAKDAADLRATELRLREVATHCATIEAELSALKAQEPVAWKCRHSIGEKWFLSDKPGYWECVPIYAAPVPAQEQAK